MLSRMTKKGLDLNSKKTEVMVTSKRPTAEGNIFIDETKEKNSLLNIRVLPSYHTASSHLKTNLRISQAK